MTRSNVHRQHPFEQQRQSPGASLGTLSNPASLSTTVSTRVHHPRHRSRGLHDVFRGDRRVGISGKPDRHQQHDSNAEDPGKASWLEHRRRQPVPRLGSSGSWTSFHDSKLKIRVKGYNPASNATISIADASAAENAGHLLFDVTLSRSLQNTVKVDFETISGGTATEGEDYHARRTYTHVILAERQDRADGLRAH